MFGLCGRDGSGSFAQKGKPPFADPAFGVLGDDAQVSLNGAALVRERTVGKRVIRFLRIAIPLEEQEERLVPRSVTAVQDALDARPNLRPDLRPDLLRRPAQRPWV